MALPAPIEMPNPLAVNTKVFEVRNNQLVSPAGDLFYQAIERTKPFWVARYVTPPLTDGRDQTFKAWLDSLEGSMHSFLAFDPRRPRPYAYRHVGGEPWVRPTFAAVRATKASYANGTITLDRFADGAIITAGDYISHQIANAWYLYRAMETRVVPTGGVLEDLKINLRPPTFTGQTYACRLTRACCAMKMIGDFTAADSVDSFPTYTLQASQFVDRS